jgi:hypothetical protein
MTDTSSTLAPFNDGGNSTSTASVNALFPMIKGSGEVTTSEIFTGDTQTRLDFASLEVIRERARTTPRDNTSNLCRHHRQGKGIVFFVGVEGILTIVPNIFSSDQ